MKRWIGLFLTSLLFAAPSHSDCIISSPDTEVHEGLIGGSSYDGERLTPTVGDWNCCAHQSKGRTGLMEIWFSEDGESRLCLLNYWQENPPISVREFAAFNEEAFTEAFDDQCYQDILEEDEHMLLSQLIAETEDGDKVFIFLLVTDATLHCAIATGTDAEFLLASLKGLQLTL